MSQLAAPFGPASGVLSSVAPESPQVLSVTPKSPLPPPPVVAEEAADELVEVDELLPLLLLLDESSPLVDVGKAVNSSLASSAVSEIANKHQQGSSR